MIRYSHMSVLSVGVINSDKPLLQLFSKFVLYECCVIITACCYGKCIHKKWVLEPLLYNVTFLNCISRQDEITGKVEVPM